MAALVAVLQGLGPPVQQLLRPPEGEGPDLLQGLFPVGGVGGVPEEEKVLVGEKPGAGPEDAHAPQTRIEDPDGAVLVGHAATPFSLCALCKGIPAQFHAHGLLADYSGIYHKNPRQYTKYWLRFLFQLPKNRLTHPAHSNCAGMP